MIVLIGLIMEWPSLPTFMRKSAQVRATITRRIV
jgi:hypothetical protein